MLPEQDDLARRADEPLPVLTRVLAATRELFHRALELAHGARAHVAVRLRAAGRGRDERDRAGVVQCALEVVEEVRGVLDADTQPDEVLGQPTRRARRGVNRSMTAAGCQWGRILERRSYAR